MELIKDQDRFETLQFGVIDQFVMAADKALAHLALPFKDHKEAVLTVVFNVCNVLDGTAVVDVDGLDLVPYLLFEEAEGLERLIVSERRRFLHDYAHSVVDTYFKNRA